MSLQKILEMEEKGTEKFPAITDGEKKEIYTEKRIKAILPEMRNAIAFFREYPDIFIDTIKGPDCKFQFLWYQRILVRCFMRYKFVYGVFPRAASKSFIAMLVLMLRAIFYPGSELFVTTGGKLIKFQL